jgi:hypothetical protein
LVRKFEEKEMADRVWGKEVEERLAHEVRKEKGEWEDEDWEDGSDEDMEGAVTGVAHAWVGREEREVKQRWTRMISRC